MSIKNDGNKIVALPNRQPATTPSAERLGEPLKSVRELTLKRISELTNTLFENIDDALFDRAEHAQTNAMQTEYFDGMREVRKKRQRVEKLTLERVSEIFTDFAMGRIQAPSHGQPSSQNANAGLALVDEADLEESLAIAGMVAKTESKLSRQLFALNRRLSAIRGGVPVESVTNPIGPAQLCDAFRVAANEFELNLQVRIIIYKLFDRYVMSGLDTVYDEVNALLIHAGVLPQLRHHVTPSAPNPAAASAAASAIAAGMPQVTQEAGFVGNEVQANSGPSAIEAEIYQTLRSLLALRHNEQGPMAKVGEAPMAMAPSVVAPSFAPSDLLSALHILQNQTAQLQARAAEQTALQPLLDTQQLKRALIEQADKLQAGPKAQVANADEDTIDLVGMMFEFIVQDRNLPSQMQALLGRLQIPFLKAALIDRHLFTHKAHPARQLLDNMAVACIGRSDDSESDQPLYEKIREIVEIILRDFDDDLGLLERANADFSSWLENTNRRVELAEKRTAETIQGREKLEHARQLAASEIRKRCEGKPLPVLFESLLNGPYAQFLVLIALRQGEASAEWKQALSFADAIIWSTAPKTTDAERTRLKNLLPSMLSYLRQSLAKVAWRDEDIRNIAVELNTYFKKQIEAPAPVVAAAAAPGAGTATKAPVSATPAEPPKTAKVENSPSIAHLVGMMESVTLSPEPLTAVPAEPEDIDEAFIEQVKTMKVGTWVEFVTQDSGMRERAKLSWISPISSKYLFVDRKGLKVADKTITALAAEFSTGRIVLLDDSMPLFDRALSAVVERLKSFQPPAPAAGAEPETAENIPAA